MVGECDENGFFEVDIVEGPPSCGYGTILFTAVSRLFTEGTTYSNAVVNIITIILFYNILFNFIIFIHFQLQETLLSQYIIKFYIIKLNNCFKNSIVKNYLQGVVTVDNVDPKYGDHINFVASWNRPTGNYKVKMNFNVTATNSFYSYELACEQIWEMTVSSSGSEGGLIVFYFLNINNIIYKTAKKKNKETNNNIFILF